MDRAVAAPAGKATPGHQFVITTRSDMLHSAGVGSSLDTWSVGLDAVQYRDGQLGKIYDNRMDQLPASLQTKAYEFRKDALDKLETPLESVSVNRNRSARRQAGRKS